MGNNDHSYSILSIGPSQCNQTCKRNERHTYWKKKRTLGQGVMARAYNPSTWELRWEEHEFGTVSQKQNQTKNTKTSLFIDHVVTCTENPKDSTRLPELIFALRSQDSLIISFNHQSNSIWISYFDCVCVCGGVYVSRSVNAKIV
jgi:hypothetical protein